MLGGIPASPDPASTDLVDTGPVDTGPVDTGQVGTGQVGTAATVLTLAADVRDWLAVWAERGSLAPVSGAGISLMLGICAAGWFTAGTRIGNVYGSLALGAGYLLTLLTREFLNPAASRAESGTPARQADAVGLVSGTSAARSAWLSMLGARLSEYAAYVGLALGAVAEGWSGVWPLAISVVALATICDTMTACTGPRRPAPRRPAPSRLAPSRLAPSEAGAEPAEPDEADPDGRPAGEWSREVLLRQIVMTALTMPPGGRVLLIVALAPILGARVVLLSLLDWGIIAIGVGIGARSAGRRRARRAQHPLDVLDPSAAVQANSEPVALSVLLLPVRPVADPYDAAGLDPDPALDDPALDDTGLDDTAVGESVLRDGVLDDRAASPASYSGDRYAAAPPDSSAAVPPGSDSPRSDDRHLVRADWTDDGWDADREAADAADSGDVLPDEAPVVAAPDLPVRYASPPSATARSATARSSKAQNAKAQNTAAQRTVPESPPGGTPAPGRKLLSGDRSGPRTSAARFTGPVRYLPGWPRRADGATAGRRPDQDPRLRATVADDARKTVEQADQEAWDAELAADPQLPPDSGLPSPGGVRAPDEPGPDDQAELAESDETDPDDMGPDDMGPDDMDPDDAGLDDAGLGEAAGLGLADLIGEPDAGPRVAAVLRNRDDGVAARWFGRLVRGQLMPLPGALLALAAVATLAHLGLRDLPGLLILAPAIIMLVAAPGASHDHGGRFDWLAPAVLQGAQYVYIAALGSAARVPAPITFALCAMIALHYADLGAAGSPILLARRAGMGLITTGRPRPARRSRVRSAGPLARAQQPRPRRPLSRLAAGPLGDGSAYAEEHESDELAGQRHDAQPDPARTELGTWMGWEGRMIACGLGAAMGIAWLAYLALTLYLGWLIFSKVRASYLGLRLAGAR